MVNSTYYFEIADDYTYEFPKGVTTIPYKREYDTKIRRCIRYSDRVWVQGPKGGVKILKNRQSDVEPTYGYVTNNNKMMKQFMWVKLKARSLSGYN